jgi:hypothetical protein
MKPIYVSKKASFSAAVEIYEVLCMLVMNIERYAKAGVLVSSFKIVHI